MLYNVKYNLWINVRGEAQLDFKPEDPNDMTDFLFSDECNDEVLEVTTNPQFMGTGYMEVEPEEDDEDDEEDDEEDDQI